ncbi:MAG TPA: dTDP-4-dehydrorhamnose 3,5-epimerase family protein [Candidatus Nitrosotalea sp.]|nr:dTDP-4-dehydrorhamnose 3,5-epimerase family protein [Candidatus Nitrosotalea sp.]
MIEGVRNNPVKSFIDDRGFLSQILPEGDESFHIARIYSTGNFSRGVIRGFHKHKREKKAFFVPTGSAKFVAVDDRKESSTFKEINTFVLSTLNPSVLTVPTGVYTGWMSLEDGTVVIGISSEKFDKDNPDDERLDPYAYGDVWKVKDR